MTHFAKFGSVLLFEYFSHIDIKSMRQRYKSQFKVIRNQPCIAEVIFLVYPKQANQSKYMTLKTQLPKRLTYFFTNLISFLETQVIVRVCNIFQLSLYSKNIPRQGVLICHSRSFLHSLVNLLFSASNPCYTKPCENGGTCHRDGERFTCACSNPFTGATCAERKSFNNWNFKYQK